MKIIRVLIYVLFAAHVVACASLPPRETLTPVVEKNYAEELITNRQGLQLFVRIREPENVAKGNIIILHGTSLHGGLYMPVMERLAAVGYRVMALDMQNWGRSQGVGGFGLVNDFEDYAADLELMALMLRQRYPAAPTYLLGESLGGTVAVFTVLQYPDLFDGVITSGVAYKPNVKMLGIRAPDFINAITLASAKLGGQLLPSMPVLHSGMGIRMTVEDEIVESTMLEDPYVCHGFLPAAYNGTLLEAGDFIEDNISQFDKPLLLLHGTEDVLVPVSSSEELFDSAAASTLKRIQTYNSPHLVLIERASEDAVGDVIEFLEAVHADGEELAVGLPVQ